MTLYKYTAGQGIKSSEVLGNEQTALRQAGKNLIRQAQDRAVDIDASGGEFVEAFVDSTGRFNYLTGINGFGSNLTFSTDKFVTSGASQTEYLYLKPTTSLFSTTLSSSFATVLYEDANISSTNYKLFNLATATGATGTTTSSAAFTNESNAFDADDATYANLSVADGFTDAYLGKTFTERYVGTFPYKFSIDKTINSYSVQYYDGSSWQSLLTADSPDPTANTYSGTLEINALVQGLRITLQTASSGGAVDFRVYAINEQLINEDTGWISIDTISSYTAFTSRPTHVGVQVTSNGSGNASIKGVSVFE